MPNRQTVGRKLQAKMVSQSYNLLSLTSLQTNKTITAHLPAHQTVSSDYFNDSEFMRCLKFPRFSDNRYQSYYIIHLLQRPNLADRKILVFTF